MKPKSKGFSLYKELWTGRENKEYIAPPPPFDEVYYVDRDNNYYVDRNGNYYIARD